MCGVAGVVGRSGEQVCQSVLRRMTEAIAHRGLDGEGHWVEKNVGIGHRRLAVIDPSLAGRQPMITNDQRYVLSYNGEVYNYTQIRLELEAEGYSFKSGTDSEVVLYALVHWGERALLKFNGMFALALWDRKAKSLLIARDRYGVKPLYYAHKEGRLIFGSEQKAIIRHPSFKAELNKEALLEYFTFQNIFTDQTLLKGIRLLPAGHYARFDADAATFSIEQYWDYSFQEPEYSIDALEYEEELCRLFDQSVKRQIIGDTELGAYLSGGIDSGSITGEASRYFTDLKSFTIGFDLSSASGIELGFDERPTAEALSALFKTEHYQMVLKAGDMERCLPSLAWHLEEPRVGQSYPNFYASKLASKFVKVVLSGTGGDELFGGYPWRYYRVANSQTHSEYIENHYQYWQRLVSKSSLRKIFAPIWHEVSHVCTRDIFSNVHKNRSKNALNSPEDYINASLYFEAKTFLHGLLVVEDKLSMAHGLESRVPFMDNDLVDFSMKCPVALKLNNLEENIGLNENLAGGKKSVYFQKTSDGKQILRNVMRNRIPGGVLKSPKQGFSSPDASWFKGTSIAFVQQTLMNKKSCIYDFLDYYAVTELVNQHLSGKQNRRLLIWSLLNVEFWARAYLR
jgi:asparagine synthase (glutamine-hydrolysing)